MASLALRLLAALLAVLAAPHPCVAADPRPRPPAGPRVLMPDPKQPAVYECLVPGPSSQGGDASTLADAAAVSAAEPRLRAIGAKVKGSFGRQVSTVMTPKQARKAKASGMCQAIYRSLPTQSANPAAPEQVQRLANAASEEAAGAAAASAPAVAVAPFEQGVKAMGIDVVRAQRPDLLGQGVKVGIISDTYFANCDVNTCTFPPNCDAVKQAQVVELAPYFSYTPADRGRAMAELICAVAPKAELFFYSGIWGPGDVAGGISDLVGKGCRVIVEDVSRFYVTEPWFSVGTIAAAANQAHAQGVAFFSAAGDLGGNAWEGIADGNWIRSDAYYDLYGGDSGVVYFYDHPSGEVFEYLNWGGAMFLAVSMHSNPATFTLQWDERYYAQSNFELILCEAPSTRGVWCYTIPQAGMPFSTITIESNPVTFYAAVRRVSSNRSDNISLKLIMDGAHVVPGQGAASQGAGTCVGAPNAAGVMAVGAASYRQTPAFNGGAPAVPDVFTSWGGQRLMFDEQGARLPQPLDLHKPDIMAPDGTDTTFISAGYDPDSSGLPNFFGTAAAASHAAAVAALMLQQWPNLQPDQIYAGMRGSALDMSTAGYDVTTGAGFINGARLLLGCTAANVGEPCDDGNPCTSDDTCQAWGGDFRCVGKPCVAAGDCQTATCTAGVCSRTARPDGSVCSNNTACSAGSCNGGTCTRLRALPEGTPCDDGNSCTVEDRCRVFSRIAGKCRGRRRAGCT